MNKIIDGMWVVFWAVMLGLGAVVLLSYLTGCGAAATEYYPGDVYVPRNHDGFCCTLDLSRNRSVCTLTTGEVWCYEVSSTLEVPCE